MSHPSVPIPAANSGTEQSAGPPGTALSLHATPWADIPSAEMKLAMRVAANICHLESLPRWRRLLGAFIGYGEPYPARRAR
jgi:hypothetical protein